MTEHRRYTNADRGPDGVNFRLFSAIEAGNITEVRRAIDAGADVNARVYDPSPMSTGMAMVGYDPRCYGLDYPKIVASVGDSALTFARKHGMGHIAMILLSCGAAPEPDPSVEDGQ
jgi:hypothetical protein